MRLYSLQGAESVQHEDESYDVDPETGAIEVPHDLGVHLHGLHIAGQKAWETDAERHDRIVAAELELRRDPASMYELMQKLVAGQDTVADLQAKLETALSLMTPEQLAALEAPAETEPEPKPTAEPAKKAPAKKAAPKVEQ